MEEKGRAHKGLRQDSCNRQLENGGEKGEVCELVTPDFSA